MPIKKLYLELTDNCNLSCKMCYRRSWGQASGDMKEDVLYKLADELKMHSELREIVIGGIGEPTFATCFIRTLELLKDYRIILTTNGTLIDERIAEYLIKYVDVITVSIDGSTDKYAEIRGTGLNVLEKNIKGLNELKKKHNSRTPMIEVQFVLTDENRNEIFKVMDIAKDLNAGKFVVSNMIPQIEDNRDNILYSRYQNDEMKNLFNQIMVYGLHKGMRVNLPDYELRTIRNCSFMDNSAVFICSSGDVAPCYRFSHSYTEYVFGREKQINKSIFGNIKKDSLMNIWNNKEYTRFRERISNNFYPSCLDCSQVECCDYINDTEMDCYGLSPSCGDCLWSRRLVQCP